MKKTVTLFLCILAFNGLMAQTTLFDTQAEDTTRYRIPAIVQTADGAILAISDKRFATGDIGTGCINIVSRKLNDGNWEEEQTIIASDKESTGFEKAHGDAAVVCDRESGRLLLMCASGAVGYGASTRANPIRVGRLTSDDNGETWATEDVTDTIYAINTAIKKAFFASGRICQSRFIKKGDYYRLYAALTTNIGSIVIYSDDFGVSWTQLGGTSSRPAKSGDEAKVEELPDRSVLLSSRRNGGRYFNVFHYLGSDFAEGEWNSVVSSTAEGGTVSTNCSCNGEILIVPAFRKNDGQESFIALQSVPFGSARTNVGIYWKELATASDYDEAADFKTGWTAVKVSDTTSAYSTMILDNKGTIHFIYENEELNYGYDIVYQTFNLEGLSDGRFTYNPDPTDGIKPIIFRKSNPDIYDLNGRRLNYVPQKGAYIQNGKVKANGM